MLQMRLARIDELDSIDSLYKSCIEALNEAGIPQWSKVYPNRQTYSSNIEEDAMFIFQDQDQVVGGVVLNEHQDKEWSTANWTMTDGKQLVIHAFVIKPGEQGKGYGKKALKLCEDHAANNHYKAIRLDAFSENPIALKLYEKNGYQKVGEVEFAYKPIGHQGYWCYEKVLEK